MNKVANQQSTNRMALVSALHTLKYRPFEKGVMIRCLAKVQDPTPAQQQAYNVIHKAVQFKATQIAGQRDLFLQACDVLPLVQAEAFESTPGMNPFQHIVGVAAGTRTLG